MTTKISLREIQSKITNSGYDWEKTVKDNILGLDKICNVVAKLNLGSTYTQKWTVHNLEACLKGKREFYGLNKDNKRNKSINIPLNRKIASYFSRKFGAIKKAENLITKIEHKYEAQNSGTKLPKVKN
jgi:hypothetical protein